MSDIFIIVQIKHNKHTDKTRDGFRLKTTVTEEWKQCFSAKTIECRCAGHMMD